MAHDAADASTRLPTQETQPLNWFRLLYVACIVALSVQAMTAAKGLRDHHIWLPALEIIGALLLLVPAAQGVGLGILLFVYVIAAVITVHAGHLPIYLVLYAATAVYLVQHDRAGRKRSEG